MRSVKGRLILIVGGLLLLATDVHAETLRLMCTYLHTTDENGKAFPTEGDDLFTVTFDSSGRAQVKREGLGAVFLGTVSDEEIVADVTYDLQGASYAQHLVINRYSGKITLSYGVAGKAGLTHFGKCRAADQRKF
jgi:hypothetical protein